MRRRRPVALQKAWTFNRGNGGRSALTAGNSERNERHNGGRQAPAAEDAATEARRPPTRTTMKDAIPLPQRCYPAHPPPVERFHQPVVALCTACILGREHLLDNPEAVAALQAAWQEATQWSVGEFLCMPDHVHLFCTPGVVHPESIKHWCRYWKRVASQCHPPLKGRWQMDVWDTQMRDVEHYDEKLSYMRQNPVRKGLVPTWEGWPYRGVIHEIRW